MHITKVLKTPILTEKTYSKISAGVYTFKVDPRVTKPEIKRVFEEIFETKVAKIRIIRSKPKNKRVGRYVGKTSLIKKAIITLKPGETLDIFNEQNDDKKE